MSPNLTLSLGVRYELYPLQTRSGRGGIEGYDPNTNIVGDTTGSTNMSANQMAALIAYRALHPQNGFDVALAADLAAVNTGTGSPWRASDGA